jgi:hypothetical protein
MHSYSEPFEVTCERLFLELPKEWKRYDFQRMSDAESEAVARLVKCGVAAMRMRCTLAPPGAQRRLEAIVVAYGDYMTNWPEGRSVLKDHLLTAFSRIPEFSTARTVMLTLHRKALRIRAKGEEVRAAHYAGNPYASLWFLPPVVPGEVYLERLRLVPSRDKVPTGTQPSAQATAIASVGDINVTVVVPTPAQSSQEAQQSSPTGAVSEPLFSVAQWSDLAIGIDDHWRYWAVTPVPAVGERFKKTDAHELKLPGDRWLKLLQLLGAASSGNLCGVQELMTAFGYLPPPSTVPRDSRARPGCIEAEVRAELSSQIRGDLRRLKDAVSDLSRELREQIDGPKGRNRQAALRVDGDIVRSGFVVGFLVPDDHGHLIFRHQTS